MDEQEQQRRFESLMADIEQLGHEIQRAIWRHRTHGFIAGLLVALLVKWATT